MKDVLWEMTYHTKDIKFQRFLVMLLMRIRGSTPKMRIGRAYRDSTLSVAADFWLCQQKEQKIRFLCGLRPWLGYGGGGDSH